MLLPPKSITPRLSTQLPSCRLPALIAACGAALAVGAVHSAPPPDAMQRLDAQRGAMQRLHLIDGIWRGPAKVFNDDGKTLELTQAERVGGFLGGTVKVIKGMITEVRAKGDPAPANDTKG